MVMGPKHYLAVEQIKKVMLSPLLLEHYNPNRTLVVAADACSTGTGVVLLQRDSSGHERAVYPHDTEPQKCATELLPAGEGGAGARYGSGEVPQICVEQEVYP